MSTGSIWLGDVVRVLAKFDGFASDDLFERATRLLGFGSTALPTVTSPDESQEHTADWVPSQSRGSGPTSPEAPTLTTVDRLVPVRRDDVQPIGLAGPDPGRLESGPSLGDGVPARVTMPVQEPLLPPRTGRSLLQLLLSRRLPDGPVDVTRLVEVMARGHSVAELPRLDQRTLRYGVQVLVDLGEGMAPFRGDTHQLLADLRTVVGTGLTHVRYFADVPTRGCGYGARWTWTDYRPPSPGTRVLIVSDFGIGGPASHISRGSVTEWSEFIARVRRSGCETVGLIPYGRKRWSQQIAALLPLVTWDRTLTVATAGMAGR